MAVLTGVRAMASMNGLDLAAMHPVQRALLVTDGTLTDALEAVFLEPIELVKIGQRDARLGAPHPLLACEAGERVLERSIVLRGGDTQTNYVYATSLIALDRLNTALRCGLLESDIPLGRLCLEAKLETYKEMLEIREALASLPVDIGATGGRVLIRTYRVFANGMPVMLITEHLPARLATLPSDRDAGERASSAR
jgi:chorismate-pyruvate lyase